MFCYVLICSSCCIISYVAAKRKKHVSKGQMDPCAHVVFIFCWLGYKKVGG